MQLGDKKLIVQRASVGAKNNQMNVSRAIILTQRCSFIYIYISKYFRLY